MKRNVLAAIQFALLMCFYSGAIGLETLTGYRLKIGSPCIGAAIPIPGNGGKDFWGNPVPADGPACVGVHELAAAGEMRRRN